LAIYTMIFLSGKILLDILSNFLIAKYIM